MSAEKVINALLNAEPDLLALVGTKIFPGVIPQGIVLPAVAYNHISTRENTTIDAAAAFALVTTRMQVTVQAKDYPSQKALIKAVRKACNYQRGAVAGVVVNQVIRDIVGPDMRDDDAGIYMQTIDFMVTYHEPNE